MVMRLLRQEDLFPARPGSRVGVSYHVLKALSSLSIKQNPPDWADSKNDTDQLAPRSFILVIRIELATISPMASSKAGVKEPSFAFMASIM